MARVGAVTAQKLSVPTTGLYRAGRTTTTSLAALAALPLTNLTGRKGITFQNQDTTNAVYLWWDLPEYIRTSKMYVQPMDTIANQTYKTIWKKSATGNEWYAALESTGGTASITQPLVAYYATAGGGAETLATLGTVGTLAAEHGIGYGDGDTLGYNTIYIRTDGTAAANSPSVKYDYILTYTSIPTTSAGYKLSAGASYFIELDGAVRTFAIPSTGTIVVETVEYL
jgi:hypothetical protein